MVPSLLILFLRGLAVFKILAVALIRVVTGIKKEIEMTEMIEMIEAIDKIDLIDRGMTEIESTVTSSLQEESRELMTEEKLESLKDLRLRELKIRFLLEVLTIS